MLSKVITISVIIGSIMADNFEQLPEELHSSIDGEGRINVNGRWTHYIIQDGFYIIEGDIIVGTVDETAEGKRRLIPVKVGNLWPNKYVPYVIDSGVPSSTRSEIYNAIKHWEDNTPINFGPRNGETDYVLFQSGSGCSATIGRNGGKQYITLAESCSLGSTIHEIGHCIGFSHTHSREDRDQYVTINWGNIIENKKHNFERRITNYDDCLTYDYGSIMHYGTHSFAKNSNIATIIPKQSGVSIGQRNGLSQGDKACIHLMYPTSFGPITSFNGLCLDYHGVHYSSRSNGGKVQMWSCHGGNNQQFYYTDNNEIRSKNGLCLDIHGDDYNSKANGGKIQMWSCHGGNNQQFYKVGNQIKSKNGLCLDYHGVHYSSRNNGGKIQMWSCHGGANQKWYF